jgi:hypothetical protein
MATTEKQKAARIKAKRDEERERERQQRIEDRARANQQRPAPVDIEALISTVANSGFRLSEPKALPRQFVVQRGPVSADEIDRALASDEQMMVGGAVLRRLVQRDGKIGTIVDCSAQPAVKL